MPKKNENERDLQNKNRRDAANQKEIERRRNTSDQVSTSSTSVVQQPGKPLVSGGQPIQTQEEAERGPDPSRPDANYDSVNASPPGRVDQHLEEERRKNAERDAQQKNA